MDGWVTTWGCALQPPDQPDDPELSGMALRQTIRVTVGGRRARLVLSNEYGERPLELGAVVVARPYDGRAGASAVETDGAVTLTFDGAADLTIPPGARAISDIFAYPIDPRTNLAVTMHVRSAPSVLTTHPGSRTTSHVLTEAEVHPLGPTPPVGSPSGADEPVSIAVAHWYFLAALEVEAPEPSAAVVCLGDSLTDGRGSTTDGNDRWPDVLADRLHAAGRTHIAVVNQAAGGSRVLRDGLGVAALRRLDRDVFSPPGVRWLMVFAGVNDIGNADPTAAAQQRIGDELIAGYDQIVDRARGHGVGVLAATLTPFGGHEHDDPAGWRERTRQRVNAWLRTSGRFEAVVDFDAVARDPDDHRRVRGGLHDGDGLHLNPVGYRALAGAVPLDLFS